jgi:hypothetical protein
MLIATSWDDGLVSDRPLLDILEKHGARASFAISPQRHQASEVPNDVRDKKYGMLVPKSDLWCYQEHEVCNHTANHVEAGIVAGLDLHRELHQGRLALEDLYCRGVDGIVWPYGVCSPSAIGLAQVTKHTYGRLTYLPKAQKFCSFNVMPVLHWRAYELKELIELGGPGVVLCGHTYELVKSNDWDWLDRFYRDASTDDRCQLVTLGEFAEGIRDVREGEVQLQYDRRGYYT